MPPTSAAAAITRVVVHDSTLQSLALGDNTIGDAGALAIARALEHNNSLRHLGLGHNELQERTKADLIELGESRDGFCDIRVHFYDQEYEMGVDL